MSEEGKSDFKISAVKPIAKRSPESLRADGTGTHERILNQWV